MQRNDDEHAQALKNTKKALEDLKSEVKGDGSGDFLEYVESVFTLASGNLDSFDEFAAKRCLKRLSGEYGVEVPEEIASEPLFSAHDPHQPTQNLLLVGDWEFEHPVPTGTLMYGFVYRGGKQYIYACDETDGDAVWMAPLEFEGTIYMQPIVEFWGERMYVLPEGGKIQFFDKLTGRNAGYIELEGPSPYHVGATSDGVLFIVQAGQIIGRNLETGETVFVKDMEKIGHREYYRQVGDFFAQLTITSPMISFYDSKGEQFPLSTVGTGVEGDKWDKWDKVPSWTSHGNLFYFQKWLSQERCAISCFDLGKRKNLWTYAPKSNLKQAVCMVGEGAWCETNTHEIFAATADRLFALTGDDTLLALDTIQDHPKKLWETDLKFKQIMPSRDGKKVFALGGDPGGLYSFDVDTGASTLLEKIYGTLLEIKLVGVSPSGLPYIQEPISYH